MLIVLKACQDECIWSFSTSISVRLSLQSVVTGAEVRAWQLSLLDMEHAMSAACLSMHMCLQRQAREKKLCQRRTIQSLASRTRNLRCVHLPWRQRPPMLLMKGRMAGTLFMWTWTPHPPGQRRAADCS